MHLADLCGVVRKAVVAPGEKIDGFDMPHFQRIHKDTGVEIGANPFTLRGGVKIEVNLAKAVVNSMHVHISFKYINLSDEESFKPYRGRFLIFSCHSA
jgi:hypothetical protein